MLGKVTKGVIMKEEKNNKPKFVKRTALTLSLCGALLATPAMLSGCQTQEPKDGANGKTWHVGSDDPREADVPFGENGDFYFDEDDFDIYIKVDGEWVHKGTIKPEETVSVAGTTYVYGVDADLNVYVDITTHYTNEEDSTVRVYPNAIINVGKVMTLDRAIEVAPTGATLMLKQDIELEETLTFTKRFTIDFNGHTISNKTAVEFEGDALFQIAEGGELTLIDSRVPTEVGASSEGLSAQGSSTEGMGGFVVNSKNLYALELTASTSKCEISGGTFVVDNAFLKAEAGVANFTSGTLVVMDADETPVFDAPSKENIVINIMTMESENQPAMFVGYNPASSGFVAEGGSVVAGPDGIFIPCDKDLADEMLKEAEVPVSISLTEDMVLDKPYIIGEGVNLTIDLNGHKIYNTTALWNDDDEYNYWSLISVRGGDLIVKDSSAAKTGTIQGLNGDCYAIDLQTGTCVIESGNFIGNISAVYVKQGNLTVKGGTFSIQQLSNHDDERFTLNCRDEFYTSGEATIIVNGGTFRRFDPSANAAETNVPNNYCAEGCGVVNDGEWYTVLPSVSSIASTTWFDEAEPGQTEFTLSTKEDLAGLAQLVNNGNNFKGKTIKLGANIDLAGYNWTPIGVQVGDSTSTNFQGNFDGQNFTVSNLTVVNYVGGSAVEGAACAVGLFGATYNNLIQNVNVVNAQVEGNHYVGALVGWSTFTSFENCSVSNAKISCKYHNEDDSGDKAGALVGLLQQGTATNCSATDSTVSAGRDAGQLFGCLAGYTTLTYLTECEATNVVVSHDGTGEGTNIQNEVFGRDRRTTPVEE